jgi:hypothetical protein
MYRKSIFIISFVFVLSLFLTSAAYPDADLVAYWKFDDGSGTTAIDSGGNGHDGTIEGDPQWVDGQFLGALEFDGSSNYVNCGTGVSFSTVGDGGAASGYTISVWINPSDPGGDGKICGDLDDPGWDAAGGFKLALYQTRIESDVRDSSGRFFSRDASEPEGLALEADTWYHIAAVYDDTGNTYTEYINGEVSRTISVTQGVAASTAEFRIGTDTPNLGHYFNGIIDELRIYSRALTEGEVQGVMAGAGAEYPYASRPNPADDSLYSNTWVSLNWRPGDFTVSHDVYFGENFDDVNDATRDSEVFRDNLGLGTEFFIAGFAGYPYPDGLINGTTYYWRIDEVNDADPNSPWKGDVWSFTVPPKTAYFPVPDNGAEFIDTDITLTWTPGFGAKLHSVVFGEDYDEVNNAATGSLMGSASYNPGPLQLAKTYYWRVDESDGSTTYQGDVWSFTTLGAVSGPNPADGTVDVKPSVILGWDAGAVAESHEVYLGTDADAVKNATKASPEYKGTKALGDESYAPDNLLLETTYYWRIDEANSTNPDSPWPGKIWSFTTGDFFVIDDFEIYDANDVQIWYSWHDGLGYGAPGTADYYAGNGTGGAVGDETSPSYTEETIVHGGAQSMPFIYDNNKQGFSNYSEVELTLADQRDWTEQGVTELSLWFRGYPASVGSFVEGPTGTYTMTASGADIWDNADQFHYAYKMLTGQGSIIAMIESVQNTNGWAKAGVMIRETLEDGSRHAFACVTPANGVAFQSRPDPDSASENLNVTGFAAPYWVKLTRDIAGNFVAYHSADGTNWQMIGEGGGRNIQMTSNVYIGLALTSHDDALACEAVFSNVTITGTVSGQWANQDIGITSNNAEPLYVAVSNTAGQPAVVVHDDANASQINTWTEWVIPLQTFADQGIDLVNVDKIALGLGTRGNTTAAGGSGKMFFDDIRLYRPREADGE